jgi:hypothetical protein
MAMYRRCNCFAATAVHAGKARLGSKRQHAATHLHPNTFSVNYCVSIAYEKFSGFSSDYFLVSV